MADDTTKGAPATEGAAAKPASPTKATTAASSSSRSAATDEMEDQTPAAVTDIPVQQDSRLNALRDAPPKARKELKWLVYEGRKGSKGTVRRTQEEHIDVVVPDEQNAEMVDAYLDQATVGGQLTAQGRSDLASAGISEDTLHLSGTGYHWKSGEATPVAPEHADWLMNHPGYSFTEAEQPS